MIKKIKILIVTMFLTAFGGITYADFNDGWVASEEGDYKTAFNEWKPLADQGDADAQYNLGVMYYKGKGALKDYKQAVKWYQKAADQGYASAQHNLGFMYAYGEGVLKDLSKAKYWIKKAYENPSANSKTKNLAEENLNELELWKY